MNDTAMCPGGDCPRKFGCIRHIGEIAGRQDFFGSPPFKDAERCEYYLDARAELARRIPREQVAARAFEIFKEDRTYHEYAWFLGEALLAIEQAIRGDPVVMAVERLRADPMAWRFNKRAVDQDDVRIAARAIAGKHAPVQDIHWSLAEASLLIQALEARFRDVLTRGRCGPVS